MAGKPDDPRDEPVDHGTWMGLDPADQSREEPTRKHEATTPSKDDEPRTPTPAADPAPTPAPDATVAPKGSPSPVDSKPSEGERPRPTSSEADELPTVRATNPSKQQQSGSALNDETLPMPEKKAHAHPLTPWNSQGGTPNGDSGESTPRPGGESSEEWDAFPPPRIARDQEIFGKYRLIEKIGEGGMGEVWLVDNLQLDRRSALKLIKPELAHNRKGWDRFQREARLMAKLNHPNAVAVYDFRRTHSMGYIEMEFIRGQSLDKYIESREGKQLPLAEVTMLLDQLCAVLSEAHGHIDEKRGKPAPIIHRDLKPSNIMLVEQKNTGHAVLKVLDFGIAKIIEEGGGQDATLTNVGDLLGTPAYMSPEQIRGGWGKNGENPIDGRSDLYSVGIMLYQLLTGKLPFRGRDPRALMAAHLSELPRPMKEIHPDTTVPAAVEQVVLQCLQKDPTQRPSNAETLQKRFHEAVGDKLGPPPLTWKPAVIAGAAVLSLGLLAFAVWPSPTPVIPNVPEPPDQHEKKKVEPQKAPEPIRPYVPAGYEAVDPNDLAEGTDEPSSIRRTSDGVTFHWVRRGVYLPTGYEPESADLSDRTGEWPTVIRRGSDGARFIRIQGGTYRRGALASEHAQDFMMKPIKDHWVHVDGFYIQETEVTNREIETYSRDHEDADLRKWRDFFAETRRNTRPPEKALDYPASCVSYRTALRYAQRMNGRLPTEAEWEFAAKSRTDDNAYPWSKRLSDEGKRSKPRAHFLDAISGGFGGISAVAVKSYPDDRTDQNVMDMAGNVSELCLDRYRPYAGIIPFDNSRENPLDNPCDRGGPDDSSSPEKYVVRGGSMTSTETKARTYWRDATPPNESTRNIGFRLVIDCPPSRDDSRD